MITRRSSIAALALVSVLAMLSGCAQQGAKTTSTAATGTGTLAEQPTGQPMTAAPASPTAPATRTPSSSTAAPTLAMPFKAEDFTDAPALKDVFFEPGRADIVRAAATVMLANARWLADNRDYQVLIEGHTDSRGPREDNLAIAERRANAAASFLMTMGVPETRLWTVSYGSDQPACKEKSEACAARNRRVHFRVKRQ